MHHRRRSRFAFVAVAIALLTFACSSQSGLSEEELLAGLEAAGLTVNRLDAMISPDQRAKLPAEPKTMFSARVSDGHGTTEAMTFIEMPNQDDATEATEYQKGFTLRNWFVLGIVSNHMKQHIEGALQ